MTWIKKYGLITLLVIAVASGLLFLWFNRKKDVSFDFSLLGNHAGILNLLQNRYAEPGSKVGIYLDIPLSTTVNNNKAAPIVMQNINGSISYNNEPILQTKSDSAALQTVTVPAKANKTITDTVQVLVNASTIQFFSELVKGNKPKIKYDFNTIIFGKPEKFSNSTTINQQTINNN